MKYKKQLRWLAFLLIPLVVMVLVHFLIPLSFILQSFPIVQDSYLSETIELQQTEVRSYTMATEQKITNIFTGIMAGQQSFLRMLKSNFKQAMIVKGQELQLNNAYNIYQKITASDFIQNIPMWFSRGVSIQQNLSSQLQAALASFMEVSPFLYPLVFSSSNQFVYSLSLYLQSASSQALYVQYPSRNTSQFSSLDYQILDSFYNATISHTEGEYVPFLVSGTDNTSILRLCTPSSTNIFSLVACLQINLDRLGRYLLQTGFLDNDVSTQMEACIVLSNDLGFSSSLQPLVAIVFDNVEQGSFQTPTNAYFNFSEANLPTSLFSSTMSLLNAHMFVASNKVKFTFVNPILLSDLNKNLPLHLVIKHMTQNSTAAQGIISETLKSLLIPILLLNFIASIVSVFILKHLLDSVDKQLIQLDSRCNFIAKGDINIQIPEYVGTQDIKDIYDEVRTINKLHRYSTQSYFSGHFAEKVLKYNEALQFFKKLNYDTGNLLENMGQSYTYIEQWDKAIETLKESVSMIMNKIEEEFASLDEMMPYKHHKQVPLRYKELEIILIRRLFKLSFNYFRYLELKPIFLKKEMGEQDKQNFNKKQELFSKESIYYSSLIKKAFYPESSSYSECIICLFNQCKQLANQKKVSEASKLVKKIQRILDKYTMRYVKTTKLLKEKGSRYKFLHMKNKLTAHSRANPEILKTFSNMFKAKIMLVEYQEPGRFVDALNLLFQGARVGVFTAAITYLSITELKRILVQELKIDISRFETTQICRQSLPFKDLYYGKITKEIEPELLKIPTKISKGLQRQFVFIFDCGKDYLQDIHKNMEYQKERVNYLFNKLVKKMDRVSIVKYNTEVGAKVQCGLILKQGYEQILSKNINEAITERNIHKVRSIEVIQALYRAFERIKHLKLEKVMVLFFKSIAEYKQQVRKMCKRKSRYPKGKSNGSITFQSEQQIEGPDSLGSCIVELMQEQGLRNMKLMLYVAKQDSIEHFRDYFNLNDINRRIWSKTDGINKWNNVVYVLEDKHKTDAERILMLKTQDVADNNVFIL